MQKLKEEIINQIKNASNIHLIKATEKLINKDKYVNLATQISIQIDMPEIQNELYNIFISYDYDFKEIMSAFKEYNIKHKNFYRKIFNIQKSLKSQGSSSIGKGEVLFAILFKGIKSNRGDIKIGDKIYEIKSQGGSLGTIRPFKSSFIIDKHIATLLNIPEILTIDYVKKNKLGITCFYNLPKDTFKRVIEIFIIQDSYFENELRDILNKVFKKDKNNKDLFKEFKEATIQTLLSYFVSNFDYLVYWDNLEPHIIKKEDIINKLKLNIIGFISNGNRGIEINIQGLK